MSEYGLIDVMQRLRDGYHVDLGPCDLKWLEKIQPVCKESIATSARLPQKRPASKPSVPDAPLT